jgi:hypothetical protein
VRHIFKLIAVAVCAGAVCNGPIFSQLLAQIVALDQDHVVRVSASGEELRLVLAHDPDELTPNGRDSGASLATAQEQPHVIVIPAGSTIAKQTASVDSQAPRTISAVCDKICAREFDIFVPQLAMMHSRPPPGEMSILRSHRSTLLLI